MFEPFTHVSWAHATAGTPMRYYLTDDGAVVFCFGNERGPFEFSFDRKALEQWLELGSKAQAELGQ